MSILRYLGVLLLVLLNITEAPSKSIELKELEAKSLIDDFNDELNKIRNREVVAQWNYATDLTAANRHAKLTVGAESVKLLRDFSKKLQKFENYKFKDEDLKRKYKKFTKLDYLILSDEDYRNLKDIITEMQQSYTKTKFCAFRNRTECNLSLDSDIQDIFSKSRDPEELKYYWTQWYDQGGLPVKKLFEQYLVLNHKSAVLNGFKSAADAWLDEYEDERFDAVLENAFDQMKPFYNELHGYVRYQLQKKYGQDVVPEKGPIPMHLLGNLWSQTWVDLSEMMLPFPNVSAIDVSAEMIKQNYTALKMFQLGNEFFQSMNLSKLPESFWNKSILEKPYKKRDFACHPSAWDFYTLNDVRVKQCTRVTMKHLRTVHHELGHIQYYLQYQGQPSIYRVGANPGFHEAVGDLVAYSAMTPKHLQRIGFLKNYTTNEGARINSLFRKAMQKIVFLPFAYTMDKFRWAAFRGEIKPENYNCEFWKLRERYSGIQPPTERSEKNFDAGAKYHNSADAEYLKYMVAFIMEFEFYKGTCMKAGQYAPGNPDLPLDNCDIYGSVEAGNALKKMLSMGSSKPWPDAMEALTGKRTIDATALMEYFEPLRKWLEDYNRTNNVHVGWENSRDCSSS